MLIVIGEARVDTTRRDQFISATTEMTTTTRLDDGCEGYGFYADLMDPDIVVSVEQWRDQEALDAHMTHAHTRAFLETVPDLVVGEPHMTVHHTQ